jgi:hypothetical protein
MEINDKEEANLIKTIQNLVNCNSDNIVKPILKGFKITTILTDPILNTSQVRSFTCNWSISGRKDKIEVIE